MVGSERVRRGGICRGEDRWIEASGWGVEGGHEGKRGTREEEEDWSGSWDGKGGWRSGQR